MIRKFAISDIDSIMSIWKNENIKAHDFIPQKYWENNFEYVKNLLPESEIYVYADKDKVLGFYRNERQLY